MTDRWIRTIVFVCCGIASFSVGALVSAFVDHRQQRAQVEALELRLEMSERKEQPFFTNENKGYTL